MQESPQPIDDQQLGFWQQHRYLLLIVFSVAISVVLVGVSMTLYYTSGAEQLDLSRPGYEAVAEQVEEDAGTYDSYSAIGDINEDSINEFEELFTGQAKRATDVDAFGGSPLGPEALGID